MHTSTSSVPLPKRSIATRLRALQAVQKLRTELPDFNAAISEFCKTKQAERAVEKSKVLAERKKVSE
jgi:hypothetical protein